MEMLGLGSAAVDLASALTGIAANVTYLLQAWGVI